MGKALSRCPYCDGEHFVSFVRADAPDLPDDMMDIDAIENAFTKHRNHYGYWFNKCGDCGGWSVYRDGENFFMRPKTKDPKKHSFPPISED